MGQAIKGAIALVTGADGAVGRAVVAALAKAGARKINAGTPRPAALAELVAAHPGLVAASELDIDDVAQIMTVAVTAVDVDLVIDAARLADPADAPAGSEAAERAGLALARAFAPVLRSNGGGTWVNLAGPDEAATNGLKRALDEPGTRVIALAPGGSAGGHPDDPQATAMAVMQAIETGTG